MNSQTPAARSALPESAVRRSFAAARINGEVTPEAVIPAVSLGRVGSACDPWFDAVWPKTVGQASKALFMSKARRGTRFDAPPRVWPGLLLPVTSTDEP